MEYVLLLSFRHKRSVNIFINKIFTKCKTGKRVNKIKEFQRSGKVKVSTGIPSRYGRRFIVIDFQKSFAREVPAD